MSLLQNLGGIFGLGLEPVVGAVIDDDGLILSRLNINKKNTTLEKLVFWRFPIPRQLAKTDIKPLSQQIIAASSAIRGDLTDIALAIPTRFLHCESVSAEYQDPKFLKQELIEDRFGFYADVDEETTLTFPSSTLLFDEIVANDKKLDYFHARLAWLDEEQVMPYIKLLRQSGLNPTVIDIEIFAAVNFYLYQQTDQRKKDIFLKPTIFIEINKEDSFALLIRKDKWKLIELDIHSSDAALLSQLANVEKIDFEGFWGELFERVFEGCKLALDELSSWEGEKNIDQIVFNSKLADLQLLADFVIEKHEINTVVIAPPVEFEASEQASKYLDSDNKTSRYISCYGAALRTMNPFKVLSPVNEYFKLNFLPEWNEIAQTRVHRSALTGITRSLVISFVVVFIYAGWTGVQLFIDRPSSGRVILNQEVEQQQQAISNLTIQQQREERFLAALSPDSIAKNQAGNVLAKIAELTPDGISLDNLLIAADEQRRFTIKINGIALDEQTVGLLERNIQSTLNNVLNIKDKPNVKRDSPDAPQISFSWEFALK